MIIKTPTKYFLAAGSADGFTPLNAFDNSLLKAGIGNTNLVRMSSIVPPKCERIEPVALPQGALVPVAYAHICSDLPGEFITAAVAIAIPRNGHCGLIMEYSARGRKNDVEAIVRKMAVEGMKTRGFGPEDFDLDSIAVEHQINTIAAAIAAVVLWD